MAFPDGWGYKWPIAINADSVISSPVADWPCLVTDAHFPAGAWAQMQPTGADLRFSLDEAGTTELYYDAPRLSVAGESAHLYVAVPSLASGADTTIWAWVGNAEATAPSAAWKQSTYPADVMGMWPLTEGTGTLAADRTSNARHIPLIPYPGWEASENWDWVATADGWGIQTGGGMRALNAITSINETVTAASVLMRTHAQWTSACHAMNVPGTSADVMYAATTSYPYKPSCSAIAACWSDATARSTFVNSNPAAGGSIVHAIGGGQMASYLNGAVENSVSTDGATLSLNMTNMRFFARYRDVAHLATPVSSFILLKRVVTADEVAIHHLMLSSPATFATAGELVAVGGDVAITITDSLTVAERIALQHRLTRRDSLAVADSIVLRHSMTLRDAVAAADAARLTHLTSVTDNIQLREMKRAITPCSGGYFENPSGSCAGAYREDDDQQSNLYQEMV